MRERERRKLHKLARHLKAEVPLTVPVSVRVMELPKRYKKWFGYTIFDGATLTIRIAANSSYSAAADTLVHEWAHALVICEGYDHKDVWGQKYSAAYLASETFDPKARK